MIYVADHILKHFGSGFEHKLHNISAGEGLCSDCAQFCAIECRAVLSVRGGGGGVAPVVGI